MTATLDGRKQHKYRGGGRMSNYLVVAHQTADSPELLQTLVDKKEIDLDAQFVLLVPATRVDELRKAVDQDSRTNAERVATQAIYSLNRGGVNLLRVSIGDESPLVAIQDELAGHPGFYKEVILSTLPADVSRWLAVGIPDKIEATFELPVTHVYGWARTVAWTEAIE
jgi:hypothetical protein